MGEKDFKDFEELLSKWDGAYVCAIRSYAAVKTTEGPRLFCGRVHLLCSRSRVDETPLKCETEHFLAGRFVTSLGSEDCRTLIGKAKTGQMDGQEVILGLGTQNNGALYTYFAPIHYALHQELSITAREPSLIVSGQPKSSLLQSVGDTQQITWELRAAEEPFESLQELLLACGLPALVQDPSSTTIEIIASTPAMISEESAIAGGQAVIQCRVAKKLDAAKLRIGYRILDKNRQAKRGSVLGDSFEWHDENDFLVGTCRVQMGGDAAIQTFVSYNDISLHQWWIVDQKGLLNSRHAVHRALDPNTDLLERMLFSQESDRARSFENAMSILLFLLGFSIANYGRVPKLQDGPDIVAITPLGHVAIIECTVGLLDKKDKLAKLVQRTKLVREKLTEAGHNNLELQPVIVTSLSREEIAANLATAGDHHIAVLCGEDIERLLAQVSYWPNADQVFQDTKKLIPVRPLEEEY